MKTRYTHGGDEHVLVQIGEDMSLEAFFLGLAITKKLESMNIEGVTEICAANASFQVRFNPDIIHPDKMVETIKGVENALQDVSTELDTRIVEMPVYYKDPWTHETLMRFRERHQDPSGTDLDYAAKINGFDSDDDFIKAHHENPWFVTMVGFVAGLPFMYQLVEREKQLEVPKYLSPRTDTPKLTVGYGGCFTAVYSVRGAGGYQMFGITPMPIYDPSQRVSHLQDFMILFNPGDIVKFKPIGREQYDTITKQVEQGTFTPNIQKVSFSLEQFKKDMSAYNAHLKEALNVN